MSRKICFLSILVFIFTVSSVLAFEGNGFVAPAQDHLVRASHYTQLNVGVTPVNSSFNKQVLNAALDFLKEKQKKFETLASGDYELSNRNQTDASADLDFAQISGGVRVNGASIHVTVKNVTGKWVIVLVDATVPAVELSSNMKTKASVISETEALKIAWKAISGNTKTAMPDKNRTRTLIKYVEKSWRAVRDVQFAGYSTVVSVDSSGKTWKEEEIYWMEEASGGIIQGRVIEFDPLATGDNLVMKPLALIRVKLDGTRTNWTDADGKYLFTDSGTTGKLTSDLNGKWARVSPSQGKKLLAEGSLIDPGMSDLVFNPTGNVEFDTAQVTAYYHVGIVHDWLVARNVKASDLESSISVNVNQKQTCNAYAFWGSINFFNKGKHKEKPYECPNTAYDTVVYHEYGHLVDDSFGGITDGGLSEGWGDTIATFITGQPLIGENFKGAGTMVRTAENDYIYAAGDEVHKVGQAWVGFTWQVRRGLVEAYGEEKGAAMAEKLILPALVSSARDIPAAVRQVVVNDDDDGNVSNGTPHHGILLAAAKKHGLESFLPAMSQ